MRFAFPRSLAILFLLLAASCRGRPNGPVVIYLVDTLRPDRLSAYGSARDTSPALRRLSSEAVRFENAYTQSTWTRPAVATLLTSRLPSEAGTLNRFGRLDESVPYLPEMFSQRGWATAAAMGNGNVSDPRLGFQRGFNRVEDVVSGAAEDVKPAAEEILRRAVAIVRAQRSSHFFLYVHVLDPHSPYRPPPAYAHLFSDSPAGGHRESLLLEYDREIRAADDGFGQLEAALRQRGFWDSAFVVFTSDHGEQFFEHGGDGHGRSLYSEETRVPLVVKYPGAAQGATVRRDPVTLADVLPTIADTLGWRRDDRWIGRSFRSHRFPADREIYFTESLDDFSLYGLQKGSRKVVVKLYPSFAMRSFRLDRDSSEADGRPVPCGVSPPESSGLEDRAESWRTRDLDAFPQVRFSRKSGKDIRVELVARVNDLNKPFLTAADRCRPGVRDDGASLTWSARLKRGDGLDLRVSGTDTGTVAPYRLRIWDEGGRLVPAAADGTVAMRTRIGKFLPGIAPDEELFRRLRNLGYLGGP